jgi:hypothetical protein
MFERKPMLYQNRYVWFIFISSLDLMLTWVILYFGGREVNPLAQHILRHFGLYGMVAFKLSLVLLVILLCEGIGRRSPTAGQWLASASIMLASVPVLLSFFLLLSRR